MVHCFEVLWSAQLCYRFLRACGCGRNLKFRNRRREAGRPGRRWRPSAVCRGAVPPSWGGGPALVRFGLPEPSHRANARAVRMASKHTRALPSSPAWPLRVAAGGPIAMVPRQLHGGVPGCPSGPERHACHGLGPTGAIAMAQIQIRSTPRGALRQQLKSVNGI